MSIEKIYLHWSATPYNFVKEGAYHTIVQGDGRILRLSGYDQFTFHTFRRNSNAVGIACACMGGIPWRDFPPTQIQIENMCREAAALAKQLGWKPESISDLPHVNRVLTHAEAAANRDFGEISARLSTGVSDSSAIRNGLPHNNYGPSRWPDGWPGGTVERWDFFQIKESDPPGSGGDALRKMIREFMVSPTKSPLSEAEEVKILLNGENIASGFLLDENRYYVKLLDLLRPFDIELGKVKPGEDRFINLISNQLTPKFLADLPLIQGFPTVDIYLNRPIDLEGNPVGDIRNPIRPFIGGVLIEKSTYVPLSDFCNELGISFAVVIDDTRSIRLSR
ncbi:N-acetylmuramoyl-L-alanine amidase [filamentous cyanobacterium LEGE 11480]|uniref:N-acetylmuramoyl-L-alanine amidase n=1 Tax=Romeriopsis navalis LEGE 11480 TaxID=2777977 RepID=A0A928Z4D8_9CYAN|nr:N-acetylmuramoyl-L-alanine amidase [Romeriopsis navalis]MBE9030155.1 N-acetylmuramoyl-L-alanine amidase [Romeriopsis navalis LEGE 11480]